MAPTSTFGSLLRRDRRAARLTQAELATRAGISVDTISVLERGVTRAPHPDTLNLLAGALELTIEKRAQWEESTRGIRLPGLMPAPVYRVPLPGREPDYATRALQIGRTGDCDPQSPPGDMPPECQPVILAGALPLPTTPLIGREQELKTICELLGRPELRLLTLTGSAGVGKTRLALQVAADLRKDFSDGVHFVPMAALNDPDLVLPAIAQALELLEVNNLSILNLLASTLSTRRILLVLDNFEQVIAAAPHLAALLEACRGVKLLVTSRQVLCLRPEQQFLVTPLALPPFSPRKDPVQIDFGELENNPAIELFLQRARAVQPDFHLNWSNAVAVAGICCRLEGIPLAIELAAPRLKLLSPHDLLARLDRQLQILTEGARDLPARQRTMRDTIAWSYDLLSPSEQSLFRLLSVFVGGWTLEEAEQVCFGAYANEIDVLEGMSSLQDKSLLFREKSLGDEPRFNMLYVLREFGLEQLEREDEGITVREAHASYFLALAKEANSQLQGAGQRGWLARLAQEHDNLRAAINWWLERVEQAEAHEAAERALSLWWPLSQLWFSQACYRDEYENAERILAARAGTTGAAKVKALLYAVSVMRAVDKAERAHALAEEALALARQSGDLEGIGFALLSLGEVEAENDRYQAALAAFEEAAKLAMRASSDWATGIAQHKMVDMLLVLGDYERAEALAKQSLEIFRARGAPRQVAESLCRLGWTLLVAQRDLLRAAFITEQGLALAREAGNFSVAGWALFILGTIRSCQGRIGDGRTLLEESLYAGNGQLMPHILFERQTRLARVLVEQGEFDEARILYLKNRQLLPNLGHKYLIADYLGALGTLEVELKRPASAARFWGAAGALRECIGNPQFPIDRAEHARAVATAQAQLGEAAFADAWAEGRTLSAEAILVEADW